MRKVIQMRRVQGGHYRTVFHGHEVEIVSHALFGGDPRTWNLIIDGVCDDCYPSKSEAEWAAQRIIQA